MTQFGRFDPTFDFRKEAGDEDADAASPTLREYHKLLWSKPLPSEDLFDLDDTTPGVYLHHRSARGEEFRLTSDAAMQTWTRWTRKPIADVLEDIPESEREEFRILAGQMGGRIVFPVRADGTPTINVERGQNSKILDRFDLTLECIRRYYLHEDNPLADVLHLYPDFFNLFEDFKGYTDFFLLQDLVSEDASRVEFLIEFEDFSGSPLARNPEEFQKYRTKGISFVQARNRRMVEYVESSRGPHGSS